MKKYIRIYFIKFNISSLIASSHIILRGQNFEQKGFKSSKLKNILGFALLGFKRAFPKSEFHFINTHFHSAK